MIPALLAAFPLLAQGQRVPVLPTPSRTEAPKSSADVAPMSAEQVWLSGTLSDEWGAPLVGWKVCSIRTARPSLLWNGKFPDDRPSPFTEIATSDSWGGWRLRRLPSFALVVVAPDDSVVALREEFHFDGRAVDLRLRPEERATAVVEGSVLVPARFALDDVRVYIRSEDGTESWSAEPADGFFRLGPMRPGAHVLRIAADGLAPFAVVLQAHEYETVDLGEVALSAPGFIAVELDDLASSLGPRDFIVTAVHPEASRQLGYGLIRSGPGADSLPTGGCALGDIESNPVGRSSPLSPGRYLLRTRALNWIAADVVVDVVSGRTTPVTLSVQPVDESDLRTLRLCPPPGDPSTHLWLRVTDGEGITVLEDECTYRKGDGPFFGLMVGIAGIDYRIEARSSAGSVVRADFVVDASDARAIAFDLK